MTAPPLELGKLPPLDVTPRFSSLDYIAPYTEETLQRWRSVGDPLADRVIAGLAKSGALRRVLES